MTPEVSTTAPAANAPSVRHPVIDLLGRYRAIFKAA